MSEIKIEQRISQLRQQKADIEAELRMLEVSLMDPKEQLTAYFHDAYDYLRKTYGEDVHLVISGTYNDPIIAEYPTFDEACVHREQYDATEPCIVASTHLSRI